MAVLRRRVFMSKASTKQPIVEEISNEEIQKVLENMKAVPEEQRTARFCCALAIAGPNMETTTVFGTCESVIAHEKRGTNGFGYDAIFFVPALERHMAELSAEEKGAISHRGNAIRELAFNLAGLMKKRNSTYKSLAIYAIRLMLKSLHRLHYVMRSPYKTVRK